MKCSSHIKGALRIDEKLQSILDDYMYVGGRQTLEFFSEGGRTIIINYGFTDTRRNREPLDFDDESVKCFCDWRSESPQDWFRVSEVSCVLLRRDRAHQFASMCGPEPSAEHFSDMMRLSESRSVPRLTVVNLAGSGASVPQHFHTQIYSLSDRVAEDGSLIKNSLARLLGNIKLSERTERVSESVTVTDVVFPLWGVKITFSEEHELSQIGKLLYNCVHREIRYRSQLALSYNLYVNSLNPREIVILFREVRKERVFQLHETRKIIEDFSNESYVNRIATSPNRFWRWAWLECIGGFPARDDSFADPNRFGWDFWTRLWAVISLDEALQNRVRERIVRSLRRGKGDIAECQEVSHNPS